MWGERATALWGRMGRETWMSGEVFLLLAQPSELVSDPQDQGLWSFQRLLPISEILHCVAGHACICAKSLQLCLTLCDPVDCSLPSSSIHGISQARILEWVAMLSFWGSSQPRDRTCDSCIAGGFFITESRGKPTAHHSSSHFDSCLHTCFLFLYACISFLFVCLFRYKDVYLNVAMAIFFFKEFVCHEWENFISKHFITFFKLNKIVFTFYLALHFSKVSHMISCNSIIPLFKIALFFSPVSRHLWRYLRGSLFPFQALFLLLFL